MSLRGKVAMITVGNTVLFLASGEASSVASMELVVDGSCIAA